MLAVDFVGVRVFFFECLGYAGAPGALGVACIWWILLACEWDERGEGYVRMRMLPGGAEKMFPTRSVIIAIVGWLALGGLF